MEIENKKNQEKDVMKPLFLHLPKSLKVEF